MPPRSRPASSGSVRSRGSRPGSSGSGRRPGSSGSGRSRGSRPGSSGSAKLSAEEKAALQAASADALSKLEEGRRVVGERTERALEAGIELFSAGRAVEGLKDEGLATALQEALEAAQEARAVRDKARETAAGHYANGKIALDARNFPAAIAGFRAALLLEQLPQPGRPAAEYAKQLKTHREAFYDAARGAGMVLPSGLKAHLAEHRPMLPVAADSGLAVAFGQRLRSTDVSDHSLASLKGRLALQSEEMSTQLLEALAEAEAGAAAQSQARADAFALNGSAAESLAAMDRVSAIDILERGAALGVNDAELTESFRRRAAETSAALEASRAEARAKLEAGRQTVADGHAEGLHWEAATELYVAGLGVKHIQHEELTAALHEALESAEVARAARDAARATAALRNLEGQSAYRKRSYPSAIAAFRAALALDTQSESLAAKLTASLDAARLALAHQICARAAAEALVKQAERVLVSHESGRWMTPWQTERKLSAETVHRHDAIDHIAAIAAFDAAAALDVNDQALTDGYKALAAETRRKQAAVRAEAQAELEEGRRKLAAGDPEGWHWEAGIDRFEAGLAVEGVQLPELRATLESALAEAEAGRDARDLARRKAKAHHEEGEAAYTARTYRESIAAFKAALALDTQSEMLRYKLTEILLIAEAALEAQLEGPTGNPMSLDLLHARSRVGRWREGTDDDREKAYSSLEEQEQRILQLFRDKNAAVSALQRQVAEKAALTRNHDVKWEPEPLRVLAPNGQQLDFVPKPKWCGVPLPEHNPGNTHSYIYKRGGQGLGYYREGSAACEAESVYPLAKPPPFTAPENSHHAVTLLAKRRPAVMEPGAVPPAAAETYIKTLAKEVTVRPNGKVFFRGQILRASEVRRHPVDGQMDAALTDWGWVSMRCPHTNKSWFVEVPTTDGDVTQADVAGSAATSAVDAQAAADAGLRERAERGLQWQWDKSQALKPRLTIPIEEYEQWNEERMESTQEWIEDRLRMRRRAMGLPEEPEEAEQPLPKLPWELFFTRSGVQELREFHGPWLYGHDPAQAVEDGDAGGGELVAVPSEDGDGGDGGELAAVASTVASSSNGSPPRSVVSGDGTAATGSVSGSERSPPRVRGRLEDTFELSVSGDALALSGDDAEPNPNTSLDPNALYFRLKLESSASAPDAEQLSYEELVASDASIVPYDELVQADTTQRRQRLQERADRAADLNGLSLAHGDATDAAKRQRRRVTGRVSSRMALCRAETRRKKSTLPPISAARLSSMVGPALAHKQLVDKGAFAAG